MVLWLGLSCVVASALTQRAHPMRAEQLPSGTASRWETVRLSTSDGETLGAWFAIGDREQPVVLLFHGNGGCRSSMLPQADWLVARGCGVLLVTLRAHGDSTGTRNDIGYSSRLDVRSAVDWVAQRDPTRRRIVWGQSVGGAAAILASLDAELPVDGYILECVFADLDRAVWNRLRMYLPPVLDQIAYVGLRVVAPAFVPHLDETAPARAAKRMPTDRPVLLLAGSIDRRATVAESQEIAASIGECAHVAIVEGGDHLTLHDANSQQYFDEIARLLSRVPPTKP
ncbi:MAG: alpha/beta fold hydrolase [Planctomycetaceae bacterium]|nr:alpha/beta fold hydrolase [Planctomycetaceae bacterium]